MMRPVARLAALVALTLLAACQMQAPKSDAPKPAADAAVVGLTPIAPDAITVTTLDNGPAAAAAKPAANAAKPAVTAPAVSALAIPVQVPGKTTPRPLPRPAGLTAAKPAPQKPVPLKTAAPELPPPEVPPEQALCEKSGGQWSPLGGSSGHLCLHRTQDSGKSCHRKSDCQGECLAKSSTCSPIKPLMGCNDILQADGTKVTLCLQ